MAHLVVRRCFSIKHPTAKGQSTQPEPVKVALPTGSASGDVTASRTWRQRESESSDPCGNATKCVAPHCLRNHGGSCDARLKLSSSSTAAERTCAVPRPGPAARRRCGGGSGCPVTRSGTPPSRSSPVSRGTPWRNGSWRGTPRFSSGARHLLSRRKRGGSVASRRHRGEEGRQSSRRRDA